MSRAACLIALASIVCLSGCKGTGALAPDALRLGVDHVSHPTAGWPVGSKNQEDGLTATTATAVWRRGAWYAETGLGLNLKGSNGGGFYGPALTYHGRIGREFQLKR